jgi:hypothetical protein
VALKYTSGFSPPYANETCNKNNKSIRYIILRTKDGDLPLLEFVGVTLPAEYWDVQLRHLQTHSSRLQREMLCSSNVNFLRKH